MIAQPRTSQYPQLSILPSIPHQGFPRPSVARRDVERFTTLVTSAVEGTKILGRSTHALLTIDLDGFTRIHSSFGPHAAGRLLVAVGYRIRECLGQDDEMMHRGGDEFHVLVAVEGNAADAWRLAELMLHALMEPYPLENRQVALTASIGVALVQPRHVRAADVTRDALAALHRAKTAGSARYALFDLGMHEATIEQLRLDADLRHAIDRDEFRMHYQPILDCRTGAVIALEALVRWEHPTRGCLLPAEFLEPLFRSGLMTEVGRWIIGEVARQSAEWRESVGFDASIAINVSPRQLADSTFVPHVLATLANSGVSTSSIGFEMTEDIELEKNETPLHTLRDLRAAGFRVRIDDFGTGYSSLSYLQRLTLDGLKLDRAFIQNLDFDVKRREIVAAIIRLAHVLDMDVVAEGVERAEQLEMLRALGCDHAQGHFLSPPLAAPQMRAWLGLQR
jgi:diguanylate cyclase (GGDEF)-like protein